MAVKRQREKRTNPDPHSKRRLSARFRSRLLALFAVALVLVGAAAFVIFNENIRRVSDGYVRQVAAASAEAVCAHVAGADGTVPMEPRTGVELARLVEALFAARGDGVLRGLIVDAGGAVWADSAAPEDRLPPYYDWEDRLEGEVSDPAFFAEMSVYRKSRADTEEPALFRLSGGRYETAVMAPVRHTKWSVVVLCGAGALTGVSGWLPFFFVALFPLAALFFAVDAVGRRLVFRPLERLAASLARLRENREEMIYGTERPDELGALSRTIRDLFAESNHDVLTGVYNRRFMENSLQNLIKSLSRSHGMLSVLMVDVDYFKFYNDTYGHYQGDICLREVAQVLSAAATRAGDFVARYGGEEFVAVLPDTDAAGARLIAEKLIEKVRKLRIPHAKSSAAEVVTVSVGVALGMTAYPQGWESYVKRADEAMYRAKQGGRNRYVCLEME